MLVTGLIFIPHWKIPAWISGNFQWSGNTEISGFSHPEFLSHSIFLPEFMKHSEEIFVPVETHFEIFRSFDRVEIILIASPICISLLNMLWEWRISFNGMKVFPNNHLSKSLDDFFPGYIPYEHSILCSCSTYTINISCKLSKLKSDFQKEHRFTCCRM